MALVDEFKIAYRISTSDASITSQITSLIAEGREDLTNTADITLPDSDDNLSYKEKSAILLYAGYRWYMTSDISRSDNLLKAYDRAKKEMLMASEYSTYDEEDS